MQKRIIFLIILMQFCSILFISEASAINTLDAAYANAKCKVDLTIGVLNSTVSINQSSSQELNPLIFSLNNVLSQLENYAKNGEKEEFARAIKDSFNPALNQVNEKIRIWRRENLKITSSSDKLTLRRDYQKLKREYDICHINSMRDYGLKRVAEYKSIIADLRKKNQNLSEQGINVGQLSLILDNAEKEIIIPLENSLAKASSHSQLRGLYDRYCLFNGCLTGINYHLIEKYESERLSQITSETKKTTSDGVALTKLKDIENVLAEINSLIQKYEQRQIPANEKEKIWNNIKLAYVLLKESRAQLAQTRRANL